MKSDSCILPPNLAAPGAGLPKLELMIARVLFARQRRRSTREQTDRCLASDRAEILRLASGCDEETGRRRVLIPRLRGLEDSSRYWSVYMTVEHLRVVNEMVADTIHELANGRVPDRVASTADVKPRVDADAGVLQGFEAACDRLATIAADLPVSASTVRYSHPWFGPLDAAGWYFMAAFHMPLHLRQIRSILARARQ